MGVGVFLSSSSQDGHPQGIEAVRELGEKVEGEEYSGPSSLPQAFTASHNHPLSCPWIFLFFLGSDMRRGIPDSGQDVQEVSAFD